MATIQERKNGTFTARVRRLGENISETFKTRTDAEAWARKNESEIERGLWLDTRQADKTTIHTLIRMYRDKKLPNLRGNGISSALNILDERLGKHIASKLTSKHISSYKEERLKEVGNETVRKEMATLSRILNLATNEWDIILVRNPCNAVEKPPPSKSRNRRLLPEEEVRMIAELKRCKSRYMLPLMQLAIETAARQGELINLKWKDVNKKNFQCTFYGTKNGDDRIVPLSKAALAILEEIPPKIREPRVFPITSSLANQAWRKTLIRARNKYVAELIKQGKTEREIKENTLLVDLHFHDLRHEAISRMAERGDLNLLELSAISGHKSLDMLKRYTHLNIEKLAKKLG